MLPKIPMKRKKEDQDEGNDQDAEEGTARKKMGQDHSQKEQHEIEKQPIPTQPNPGPFIPHEIVRNILKYAHPRDLSKCMRASKTFYAIAGPLLYSNVIVKHMQPLSCALKGLRVKTNEDGIHVPKLGNRKAELLTHVQQLTIATHLCLWDAIGSGWFPNLKTVLIIPYADGHKNQTLCGKTNQCPILDAVRPNKIVIHNSRTGNRLPRGEVQTEWPMPHHRLTVECPVLTLVFDEFIYRLAKLPRKVNYRGVDWNRVKEIRMIVSGRLGQRISKIGQRKYTPASAYLDKKLRRVAMLAALIIGSKVPLTIYVFDFYKPSEPAMISMQQRLETLLATSYKAEQSSGSTPTQAKYTFKTLSDYIAEGHEDELLWQELQCWRELYQRLNDLAVGEDGQKEEEKEISKEKKGEHQKGMSDEIEQA